MHKGTSAILGVRTLSQGMTVNDNLRLAAVQLDCIPNAVTAQQRYWVPEEPLLGPMPLSGEIRERDQALAALCGDYDDLTATRELLGDFYADSIRARLHRVLKFCEEASVDIVVFPEYSVPPRLLETLVGFSSEMVIVAGIGVVRDRDLEQMSSLELDELPKLRTNAAVVLGPEVCKFVTKKHPADQEYCEEGDGPALIEVEINGIVRRVGVAICMDYAHVGHTFMEPQEQIDVVAIPALSSTTDIFIPDQPRDFARVLSNHATLGGSQIIVPRPQAAAFVESGGSVPALAHEEVVIVCDFNGFQTAPKTMSAPRNRLLYRASVIVNPTPYQNGVLEALASVASEGDAGPELLGKLTDWQERLAVDPPSAGLAEALGEYRRLAGSGVLDVDDRRLLSTHIRVPHGVSGAALRAQQASLVAEALKTLKPTKATRGALLAYEELAEGLQPPEVDQPLEKARRTEPQHSYFSLSLGRYNEEDAQATFPYQLDLLRAFALSFPSEVSLTYRLTTSPIAETNDMGAGFDVVLGGSLAPEKLEALVSQFARGYRAILLSGWSCYGSDASADLGGKHRYLLSPADQSLQVPAIRSDWGAVVDVVRAQAEPLGVQLSCTPLSGEPEKDTYGLFDQPGAGLVSSASIDVVEFLRRQDLEHAQDPPSLDLRLEISSNTNVTDSLLNLLGTMILGHDRFQVRELTDEEARSSSGFAVRPDQALRIFHPPHGHIEGRGLRGSNPPRLHARDVPITQSGCVIGRATAARAYVDTDFDVAIDDRSRLQHVYIVGKTGTGKTNLLKNMVRQDIAAGAGVAIIDPHGDLADHALGHCTGRAKECIYLDFTDRDALPVLNPFGLDIDSEQSRLLAVEELIEQLVQRSHNEFYGPRFEDMVRLALDTLALDPAERPTSLLDVPRVLRDKAFRMSLLANADAELRGRWHNVDAMKPTEQAEVINWVLSKFSELEQSDVLRRVLSAGDATVSIANIVNGRGILIARLPEVEIGARASSFLGAMLVTRLARHIVSIASADGDEQKSRQPFYLYVDEFQKFVGAGFEALIPEARKFDLGLVLAHQNTDQLNAFSRYEGTRDSSVLTQILGNVGSIVAFRGGSRDAKLLSQELRVSEESLLQVGRFQAIARILRGGIEQDPMTISVKDSADEPGYPETRRRIRQRMRNEGVVRPGSDSSVGGVSVQPSDELRFDESRDASTSDVLLEDIDLPDIAAQKQGSEPGGVRTARRRWGRWGSGQ